MPKIVIDNFQNGLASSPYVADGAFAYSQGLDIDKQKGIIRLGEKTTKNSGATVSITGQIRKIIFDQLYNSTSTYYAIHDPATGNDGILTSTNVETTDVWATLTAPETGYSQATITDISVWKDYLFVVCLTSIDVYGPLSGSPTWTKGWQTVNSDIYWHPTKIGKDGKLYIGNGNDLASVEEVDGQNFAPGTASTYVYSQAALDLPENEIIKVIEESDWGLLLGTIKGTGFDYGEINEAVIYPWDRVSVSYNAPASLKRQGVHAIKDVDGAIIVQAGLQGELYQFMGSYLKPIGQINAGDLTGEKSIYTSPFAFDTFEGKLLIGTQGSSTLNHGIYSYKNGIFNLEYILSTGTVTGTTVEVRAINSDFSTTLLFSWRDNATYGTDYKVTNRYTSYAGYFESLVYPVGTAKQHAGLQNLSIQLVRKLQTGEGVRISYRSSIGDSYTTLVTFDFATYGAIDSLSYPFTLPQIENIQIKAELTTGANSANTPLLRSIVLE